MTGRNDIVDALEVAIEAARNAGLMAVAARLEALAQKVGRRDEADAA